MRLALAALLTVVALIMPACVQASAEEFATLDVAHPEEDDENALDHALLRTPLAWREAWERAPLAFRTSQGCVTAGQWVLLDDLKLRAATGRQSRFELQFHRELDNDATFDWLQFEWGTRLPRLPGRFGGRFRPSFDKARQDFAGWWETGDDSASLQLRATFTIEDAFNELWSFRQARVGDRSEPYERHPYEPALRLVLRGGDFAGPRRAIAWNAARGERFELNGQWLTASKQRLDDPFGGIPEYITLWGAKASSRVEVRRGRWSAELSSDEAQATRGVQEPAASAPTVRWNRRWSSEAVARAAIDRAWWAELRWLYQERAQDVDTPTGRTTFRAIDRMPAAEIGWQHDPDLRARVGFMRDRAAALSVGEAPAFTYGDRWETRLYVGLSARFGRVQLQGVEGVELDREPYEVSFHHDKGFLQMQVVF